MNKPHKKEREGEKKNCWQIRVLMADGEGKLREAKEAEGGERVDE